MSISLHFLRRVPEENSFLFSDGHRVRSLIELEKYFDHMPAKTFRSHVKKGKNDFAIWIKDTLGDKDLSDMITGDMSKFSIRNKIRQRIISIRDEADHIRLENEKDHFRHGFIEFIYGAIFGAILMLILMKILSVI